MLVVVYEQVEFQVEVDLSKLHQLNLWITGSVFVVFWRKHFPIFVPFPQIHTMDPPRLKHYPANSNDRMIVSVYIHIQVGNKSQMVMPKAEIKECT